MSLATCLKEICAFIADDYWTWLTMRLLAMERYVPEWSQSVALRMRRRQATPIGVGAYRLERSVARLG